MAKYVVVDNCPCPARLAPVLQVIKRETGCSFASIYRGTDARALLNQCGKHDQAWLYANLPAGQANPPGRSTHELRSDGVPYAGPIGRRLLWWQCGMDVDDAHVVAFISAAAKHGWAAFRPYSAGVEYHHLNFKRLPRLHVFTPLKRGDRKLRVRYVVNILQYLGYLPKPLGHPKSLFSGEVYRAVKRFQKIHHLTQDGIVGEHTWTVMKAVHQARKRSNRKK